MHKDSPHSYTIPAFAICTISDLPSSQISKQLKEPKSVSSNLSPTNRQKCSLLIGNYKVKAITQTIHIVDTNKSAILKNPPKRSNKTWENDSKSNQREKRHMQEKTMKLQQNIKRADVKSPTKPPKDHDSRRQDERKEGRTKRVSSSPQTKGKEWGEQGQALDDLSSEELPAADQTITGEQTRVAAGRRGERGSYGSAIPAGRSDDSSVLAGEMNPDEMQ